jgi:hypothetical protein
VPQDRGESAYQVAHLGLVTVAIFREEPTRPSGKAVLNGAAIHAAPAESDVIGQKGTP